jgi:uncharacterized protein YecE (DUF72 family)
MIDSTQTAMPTLYLGCPIWANKDWLGDFFPKGTQSGAFLREYARRLNTVEGNTTFYAVPSAATLARWRAETPDTFRLCPKIPRDVSHAGPLQPRLDQALQFAEHMRAGLGARLGPAFLQLPPRYAPKLLDDLTAFLAAWPPDLRLAVEVRHLGWFDGPVDDALNDLLRARDMARVLIDTRPIRDMPEAEIGENSVYVRLQQAQERKPNVPLLPERTASFAFVRYIGHPNIQLNDAYLDEWARRAAGWLADGADVFFFCHCPDDSIDPWLCRALHQRINLITPIAPLPWDQAGPPAAQQGQLL